MDRAPRHRVVVTGMGALTPIGLNVADYWDGLKAGRSGAGPITRFDSSGCDTHFACELKGFKATDYLDRKMVQRLDPYSHYGVIAADEAMKHADLRPGDLDPERIGVVFGSGIGGLDTYEKQFQVLEKYGIGRVSPFFIPMMIADIAAGHISIKHGLKGPNYAVVSACATASHAIGDAWMLLSMGMADAVLAGGSEAAINIMGIGGFNSMKAMSTRNDEPETASRPFDATRDGFVLGEGGGVLVLETLEHAQKRGATIHAELSGYGASADSYHMTAPPPDGDGARRAMRQALQTAGLSGDAIDYINVHGTSTPLGDIAETEAIKTLFGDHARELNISSTKSMTGHLLGAAGAVEAIATVMAVKEGIIPPTINYRTPDPACDLNITPNEPVKREIRAAISNTLGFGGHNASLLFTRFDG